MLCKQKKGGQKKRVHNFEDNTPISFSVSNMHGIKISCKLSFFVMISSPFSSLYVKHKFINLKIAFLSETKGIAPGTAQQERKLKQP